jgi:thiol-disulfide isomerase/thioredoxin
MATRILILAALVVAVIIAWRLLRWRATRPRDAAGLRAIGFRSGLPAILSFTAPGCAPCETVQAPALRRLAELYGASLQILEVDAAERPDLADAWGVLAVPTTFAIDRAGRPRRVNHGPTRAHVLLEQLAEIGEPAARLESNRTEREGARPGTDEGPRHGTIPLE